MSDVSETVVPPPEPRPLWRRLLGWLPIVLVIAVGVWVFVTYRDFFTLSEVIRQRADLAVYVAAHPVNAALIYVAIYVAAVVFSVPGGSFITILGGILFGGIVGGLITTIAATIGAVLVYWVAKSALRNWVAQRIAGIGPRAARTIAGLRDNAFYVVVVLRLIPVMPFWASNAIPALVGVRFDTYVLATLVGLLPWTVGFAYIGVALDDLVVAQELANPGCALARTCQITLSAISAGPVAMAIGISALSLIPVFIHWYTRRKRKRHLTPV